MSYGNVTEAMHKASLSNDPTPWLHGRLDRKGVDKVLRERGGQEGLFLVRESTKHAGDFVLSMMYEGKVQHYIISNNGAKFNIDDGPAFPSLADLVNYYKFTADRLPRKLGEPCYRDGAAVDGTYETVGIDAPPVVARTGSQKKLSGGLSALLGGVRPAAAAPPTAAPEAEDDTPPPIVRRPAPAAAAVDDTPPPINRRPVPPPQDDEEEALPPRPPLSRGPSVDDGMAQRSPAATSGWGKVKKATLPENREKLAQVPRVKKWIDAAANVQGINLEAKKEDRRNLPEGFSDDALQKAAQREEAFSQAALAEEKLYLNWLNIKLKKMGKDQVLDLSTSLAKGNIVIDVIAYISKAKPPMHAARPTVIQQEIDNWHVVVKWMRKLGIQVDNQEGTDADIGLDPLGLHQGERREMLKLFSKLLMFENQCN